MPQVLPAPASIRNLPSWLLGRAGARGRGLVAAALAEEGMRMWHHAVLAAVADYGPVGQADLGRAIALDPKDVVGILNDLERDGLLTRAPDPKDRRKNAVSLTPGGRAMTEACTARAEAANEALLAPLTPAERALFLDMLHRVSGVRTR
ncbi:MarR family winged helix-turn-helix transcriptional regulator [Streptomyces sp. NPDC050560]|uniref:MarR family winged helix-turn-helix transcriptional regulator n=1 Tax=Streptomyces sp. NPDC050560 TaxID=3365630 RepID=UPI0037AD6CCE